MSRLYHGVEVHPDLKHMILAAVARPKSLCVISAVNKSWNEATQRVWQVALAPCYVPYRKVKNAQEFIEEFNDDILHVLPDTCWGDYDDDDSGTPAPGGCGISRPLVAGSFALHAYETIRTGKSPKWRPRDIDVWMLNRGNVKHLAKTFKEVLEYRFIGICIADVLPQENYGSRLDSDPSSWTSYLNNATRTRPIMAEDLRKGRCCVTNMVDLYLSFNLEDELISMGKVSFIGTRPAEVGMRHWRETLHLMPLTQEEVLRRFDIDICRVGFEIQPDRTRRFFTVDQQKLIEALLSRRATQTRTEGETNLRAQARRDKYTARGYVFQHHPCV